MNLLSFLKFPCASMLVNACSVPACLRDLGLILLRWIAGEERAFNVS